MYNKKHQRFPTFKNLNKKTNNLKIKSLKSLHKATIVKQKHL